MRKYSLAHHTKPAQSPAEAARHSYGKALNGAPGEPWGEKARPRRESAALPGTRLVKDMVIYLKNISFDLAIYI